jgi:hypothetical protein
MGLRIVALTATLVWAPAAAADRLVLVDADPELARATILALGDWEVQVIVAREEPPGRSIPEASDRAAEVARRAGARTVVWTAGGGGRPTLWIYDLASGRTVALELAAAPPFDAPTAAGVALAIKTVLRSSQVAPVGERLEVPRRRTQHLWLEARGGAHLGRGEPRAALGAVWRPWGGASAATAWLAAGPGVEIDRATFIGHADDLELGAAVRFDLPVVGRLALVPGLGLALHIDAIRGTAPASDESAHARRYNPAGLASLALALDTGRGVRFMFSADAAARARRQSFVVAGEDVYEIAPLELTLGLGLAVPLL